MPGGLDEHAPGGTVAGFGQRAPALRVAGGVLARHQAQVRHELARPAKASEVYDLRDHDHRRERIEATEVPQPAHGLAIGLHGGECRDLFIEWTWMAVSSPARKRRTSLAASRRSVLTRWPGRRGVNAGAMTSQATPSAMSRR